GSPRRASTTRWRSLRSARPIPRCCVNMSWRSRSWRGHCAIGASCTACRRGTRRILAAGGKGMDAGGALEVTVIPVTAFQQNCSLLRCAATGRAAVVDPGGELDRILDAAKRADARIEKILVTHAHIDHAG